MKTRVFTVSSLLASLALLLALPFTLAVAAQAPQPQPMPFQDWEGGKPLLIPSGASTVQDTRTSAVALGEPGLSFRYVQTFGETEVPYFGDTAHLNCPRGVGTDGTNVWIAECDGRRALKYASDGTFVMQIGRAGFSYATEAAFVSLLDVAVDASGNVWLVDEGAHYVPKFDSSGNYLGELGTRWSSGPGNDRFHMPVSIAFDSAGNIYVSDGDNYRIQVFDSSETYLTTIGETDVPGSDNGHFNWPRHLIVDSNNRLYVADIENHRVQIFDVSNVSAITYLATLGVPGVPGSDNAHLNYPQGVAVDVGRGRIYVADGQNERVQVFDYGTRTYQTTLSGFSHVDDVAVDSAGNLYVAESYSHVDRVQQFDSNLNYVRTYGTSGVPYVTDGYHYYQPSGVAVAPDGSLYIGEALGRRLVKLNAVGEPQWTIGTPGVWRSDNYGFTFVEDVDLDGAGRVYVVDRDNHRVQIYNADGSYYASLGTGQGTGDYQFERPLGVAVGPDGTIYVADNGNARVQVYDSNRNYLATIGETGVWGSDNDHFDAPEDVDVDPAGYLYVADHWNARVQVFDSNRVYVRTIGESGVPGDDFGHLDAPAAVTVDAAGRTFVADQWGDRVQVFDSSGAYLTTIGGSGGSATGQMRSASGLAVDALGNLYVAERENHRIQKLAPGVPGWRQVNINGFGERSNSCALSLTSFGTDLYAGTYSWSGDGAQLWRQTAVGDWSLAKTGGLGNAANEGIDHLIEFDGQLYAGTWANDVNGGEVWRSGNGTNWVRVVSQGFGDPTNAEVFRFDVFDNQLYASTYSYSASHGGEVWRSATGDSGDWAQVVSDGFDGDANNVSVLSFEGFNGHLYAGTWNYTTGGEVWRSPSGDSGTWTQVNTDGFGGGGNGAVSALAAFDGSLYASTGHTSGAGSQLWRCQDCDGSDWEKVVDNGQGNADSRTMPALEVFEGRLYFAIGNRTTGLEVWRTADGSSWEQIGFAGLGDSNNNYAYWDNSVTVSGSRFFVSTCNGANGGEVWLYLTAKVYLPLVVRSQ